MKLIERRIGLLFALFLLLFAIAATRALYLHTAKAGQLQRMADGQQVSQLDVPAQRGQILDRKGEVLATSESAMTVYATPYQIKNPLRVAQRIAPWLGEDVNGITAKLSDRKKGFVYLKRQLDLRMAKAVERMGIEGIGFIDEPRRRYPQRSMAVQILGVVGIDGKGLSGIELEHEKLLHGSDGSQQIVKNAHQEPIQFIETRRMQPGGSVQLTIDSVLQAKVEEELAAEGKRQNAKSGTAIVMRPTGEILAMASWPSLDPSRPETIKGNAMLNMATGFPYEPGSTFKPFTVAAAMEEGKVRPDTIINAGPTLQVADRTIENAHGGSGCSCSVATVLAQSINTATATIGLMLDKGTFDRYVRKFGFGKPTGIDFPGEEQGLLLEPSEYSGPTQANMSIGQGLSTTPIQLTVGYAAIANGGILRPPHILKRVGTEAEGTALGHRVMSSRTAADIREMLKGVVSPDGTAREAEIPGYEIAGKTGTAEKVVNGTYSTSAYVATFVGFAPASRPELITAAVFDEPEGQFGGVVSAPVFEKIMSFALPYFGVAPR